MKIGIKVGSSLLTNVGNGLNNEMVLKISQQIAELSNVSHQVFLVTSGAVASDPQGHRAKNLRAAVGMGRLISRYIEYFDIFDVEVAQVLLTDRDLHDSCRGSLIELLNSAMDSRIVPIINANDSVDWQELRQLDECADNDILFTHLCLALEPDMAIIGFDESAVRDQEGKLVRVISEGNFKKILSACQSGNQSGHGQFGMATKMAAARILASNQIKTLLAPGRSYGFILEAVSELDEPTGEFGTRFIFDQLELDLDDPEDAQPKTLAEIGADLGFPC